MPSSRMVWSTQKLAIRSIFVSPYSALADRFLPSHSLAGFASKWFISEAAVAGEIGAFRYLIPGVLLVSALLTAGYLLSIVIAGFFPGREYDRSAGKTEPGAIMLVPMVVVTAAGVLAGIFAGPIHSWFMSFV